MFIDRPSATFAIQLTNRVHPSRNWSNTNVAREALGESCLLVFLPANVLTFDAGYYVAKALGRNVTTLMAQAT